MISYFSFPYSFSPRPIRLQESDGEKSEQDLVVDIANDTVSFPNKQKKKKQKTISLHTQKEVTFEIFFTAVNFLSCSILFLPSKLFHNDHKCSIKKQLNAWMYCIYLLL